MFKQCSCCRKPSKILRICIGPACLKKSNVRELYGTLIALLFQL